MRRLSNRLRSYGASGLEPSKLFLKVIKVSLPRLARVLRVGRVEVDWPPSSGRVFVPDHQAEQTLQWAVICRSRRGW